MDSSITSPFSYLLTLTGLASTFTPINVWDVSLVPSGGLVEVPVPVDHNTLLFVRQGRVRVDGNGE